MDPRLETRVQNAEPKCWSCGWWRGGYSINASAGHCDRHNMKTLSLSVCQDWRDVEPVQEVLGKDE